MTLRFLKATREAGVDGHFGPDSSRVTVKPTEFPKPIYPEDKGFWWQFGATIDAAGLAHDKARMTRGVSRGLEDAIGANARGAAELVHFDWPTEILTKSVRSLSRPRVAALKGIERDFTDGVVLLNHLMSWAAHMVSPNSFCAKWEFMVPRPEEVAGAIARGELDAPEDIRLRLFDMVPRADLAADQRKFTVYPEGCPDHPSYNAMHSAAAGAAVTVVKVLFDLSEAQEAEVNLAARNMAYFRTVAGVHYPQDNAVGLWLGQETVNRLLPKKMEVDFGVFGGQIEERLKAVQVEWMAGLEG